MRVYVNMCGKSWNLKLPVHGRWFIVECMETQFQFTQDCFIVLESLMSMMILAITWNWEGSEADVSDV